MINQADKLNKKNEFKSLDNVKVSNFLDLRNNNKLGNNDDYLLFQYSQRYHTYVKTKWCNLYENQNNSINF